MRFSLLILVLVCIASSGPYNQDVQYIFPLPDSELLPITTTIILRLEDAPHRALDNISGMISVSDSDGNCSGSIFWSTDQRTLIFKPHRPFQLDDKIEIKINLQRLGSQPFVYHFYTAPNMSPDAWTDTQQTLAKTQSVPLTKPSPLRIQNGVPLPSDFPKITTQVMGKTEPGKIFFATNYPEPATGNYLIICENDGTPYFYRKYPNVTRSGNFTLHPNGLLTAYFYNLLYYTVLDSNLNEVEQIRAGHGYETDNHELRLLENDHALLISRDRLQMDMSTIVSGGKRNAVVLSNIIQELDKNRNVIFEWRGWDHYDIRDSYINIKANSIDYVHANSIAVDYDSNLVISARDMNEFTKIDRKTGQVIWRLAGRNNEFTFLDEEIVPAFAHDFRPLKGKPNSYTLFDNGRGRNPQFSRGVEYALDLKAKTVKRVWQFRHTPDWYTSTMGSMQRFDSGHTFLDFPGSTLRIVEVDENDTPVFEMISRGHSDYRCRRYPWNGKLLRPELLAENMGMSIRLFFNQFGDSTIQQYKIYYGQNKKNMDVLATTDQRYYDVDAIFLQNNTTYAFKVTSINNAGTESEPSNIRKVAVNYLTAGENAVQNGSFQNMQYWQFSTKNGALATSSIKSGQYNIDVQHAGTALEDIQLLQSNIPLFQDKYYTFSFDAIAERPAAVEAKVVSADGRDNYGEITVSRISTSLQNYQFKFKMPAATVNDAQVIFNCGLSNYDIIIDNVALIFQNSDETFEPVRINFQTSESPIPDNYLQDVGLAFRDRRNGYSYGWVGGANNETRQRNMTDDLRYDTFNHMQKEENKVWEIAIPSGTYQVKLAAGDAGYTNQINSLMIEDNILQDPDGEDNFDDYQTIVTVLDNRLTLQPAADAVNTKICYLDILPVGSKVAQTTPAAFVLLQNYPNPFNPQTHIKFHLANDAHTLLTVYNILGKQVECLLDEYLNKGTHTAIWRPQNQSSGIYYYQLKCGKDTETKKMMLLQ